MKAKNERWLWTVAFMILTLLLLLAEDLLIAVQSSFLALIILYFAMLANKTYLDEEGD